MAETSRTKRLAHDLSFATIEPRHQHQFGARKSESLASGSPSHAVPAHTRLMTRTPDRLPDPWLFNSEKLIRELDRCRELVNAIAINDAQATHFTIHVASNAIYNLTEHIRYLLCLHRQMQKSFASKAITQQVAVTADLGNDEPISAKRHVGKKKSGL